MGAPKGFVGNPYGRPVGAINQSTRNARTAISKFVDDNADRLTGWLDRMAEDNPKAAFEAFMSVVEYHIPKLQRSEITGKDGEDLGPMILAGSAIQGLTDLMREKMRHALAEAIETERDKKSLTLIDQKPEDALDTP